MDISVTGARIWFTIPICGGITITSTQVNSMLVILALTLVSAWLTHDLKVHPTTKRQLVAEYLVEAVYKLVRSTMGEAFLGFAPFIGALISMSALSSLISLLGLYSPTADLNTELGWALMVFVQITYSKMRGGVGRYAKGFLEPIPVLLPFNILSELATPISMAFRHFGNIASGGVISSLVYAALAVLSHAVFGWLPGLLGEIPYFQAGLPAVLSIYFDVFSGCLQAFIFCMLTMIYISMAAEDTAEAAEAKKRRRAERRARGKTQQA